MKTKIWLGIGSAAIIGSAVELTNGQDTNWMAPSMAFAQESAGGEGGEGGGGAIDRYSIGSNNAAAFVYEARPQIEAYVDLVRDSYSRAVSGSAALREAVEGFLAAPSDQTLATARRTWIETRRSYLVTEAFRFYDGPIEDIEGGINAWPMNEAAIDYVEGNPSAGIVNSGSGPLTLELLVRANQAVDEANVTIGWHAIEFLLWGQDKSSSGPGNRPASDYVKGSDANERRREYLSLVTGKLHDDLSALRDSWETSNGDAYAAKFLGLEPREAIGRMLNGIAILAGFEFMSERLAVALDSGDQEDEHSCFSDTTHQDFVYDLVGIEAVWRGDNAGMQRPGLDELLRSIDQPLADEIDGLLATAKSAIDALGDPWDKVLAADPSSPERQAAENAVVALQQLGTGFKKAGGKLGVLVIIPSG